MEQTKQVMRLELDRVTYVVIRKLGQVNPFHVYAKWREIENERPIKHQKLIAKYANLEGCIYCIMNIPGAQRELKRDCWRYE